MYPFRGARWLSGVGVQHKADEADALGAAIMPGSGAYGLPGGSSTYTSIW